MLECTQKFNKICDIFSNIIVATGFICKRRWQVLRNAYRNHIKFGYKVSPNGIEPHLGFLRPFFRSKAELQTKSNPEDSLEYCKKLVQIVKEYPHLYFDNRSTASSDDWQEVATRMGSGGWCIDLLIDASHWLQRMHLSSAGLTS